MRQTAFLLSFILLHIIFACTEPTPIGSELLEEDQANLSFSNAIPVNAKTVEGTPIPSYSPFATFQLPTYLFGEINDPTFGKSTASIYTQVSRNFEPPFSEGIFAIDSIILSLELDSLNNFGSFSEPLSVEVYKLQEDMLNTSDYTSDRTFMTEADLIGEATFTPSFIDSIEIDNYISGTDSTVSTMQSSHIRVPLKIELGQELLDSTIYASDTTFLNFLRGIYIKPATSNGGLVSFNFNSSISRITLYYRSAQRDILYEYRYPFTIGNARNSLLVHETEGAAIGGVINQENADFLYLQSMAGSNIELNFPDLSGFENIVVNKAELELTVATEETDTTRFPLVQQIIASSLRDGEIEVVDDVLAAILSTNPISTDVFGGIPVKETVDGVTLTKYKINLSSYFQTLLDGRSDPNILLTAGATQAAFYLPIVPKGNRGNTVVLYGPSHPEYAPKLNLIYTDL